METKSAAPLPKQGRAPKLRLGGHDFPYYGDTRMSKSSILSALLSGAALVYSGTSLAAEDPKPSQVYEALRAHHVAEAEQMIDQALRAHPRSGEAHYVAAEVYAAAG